MTAEEKLPRELKEIDKLIWWIDYGQYQGAKVITIPEVKPITAKGLVGRPNS